RNPNCFLSTILGIAISHVVLFKTPPANTADIGWARLTIKTTYPYQLIFHEIAFLVKVYPISEGIIPRRGILCQPMTRLESNQYCGFPSVIVSFDQLKMLDKRISGCIIVLSFWL
ncbi:MAG: hypothetical protein WC466_09615, partial [Candidatus Izemoplasmatales bacterium]